MKTTLRNIFGYFASVAMLVLLLASASSGAPFLVCDPQANVDVYRFNWTGEWEARFPAQANGSMASDLGPLAPGEYSGQVQAGREYRLNGEGTGSYVWSDASPFSLTKPAGASVPTGFDIVDAPL